MEQDTMSRTSAERHYTDMEEIWHTLTHGLGAILAITGLVFVILKASSVGGADRMAAAIVYGTSMVLLYLSSTLYHGSFRSQLQPLFNLFDHSAIYLKIAGTYTPFALIILKGMAGPVVLIAIWVAAIAGIAVKVIAHVRADHDRWRGVSLAFYLIMGWAGVVVMNQMFSVLDPAGFAWLMAGGVAFTVGAIFYAIESIPYGHTIWHVFVLAGSGCHFVSIYGYVI